MELKARLNKVSIRTLRDDTEIILADGSKLKGTIRKIYSTVLRMPRTAIENWKKYFGGLKNIFFFDNIRSLKVKSSLEGMIKSTWRRQQGQRCSTKFDRRTKQHSQERLK